MAASHLEQQNGILAGWRHFLLLNFFFMLLVKHGDALHCTEPTTESLLRSLKESVLDKTEVRPVHNLRTPTNVSVSFILYGIIGVDEKAQTFESFIWLYLNWNIEGLSWDPEECGADRITLPRKKLWMPDIVLNEFMDENRSPVTYYLYVEHTGQVTDGFPVHVISSCEMDIYTFPFDIQNCSFTFNSFIHYTSDVQMRFFEPAEETLRTSLKWMKTKGEWELLNITAENPEVLPQNMNSWTDTIIYHIVLRRRPAMYIVNLLIPSCFLITLDLFSFLLPPQNVDRCAFKMTLILGYTVFLLLMNDLLPVTGSNLPLINVFFSMCLALMVVSLLESILITNVQCGSSDRQLPRWIRVLCFDYLSKLVCLRKTWSERNNEEEVEVETGFPVADIKAEGSDKTSPEVLQISRDVSAIHQQIMMHYTSDRTTEEWQHFGQVMDRLFFGIYVLFLTVSSVTIFVLWLYWYNIDAGFQ